MIVYGRKKGRSGGEKKGRERELLWMMYNGRFVHVVAAKRHPFFFFFGFLVIFTITMCTYGKAEADFRIFQSVVRETIMDETTLVTYLREKEVWKKFGDVSKICMARLRGKDMNLSELIQKFILKWQSTSRNFFFP